MNNLNSVVIEGDVARDPEMSTTPKGTAVLNLRLASTRYYKQDDEYQKEVSCFDIVAEHVEFKPEAKRQEAEPAASRA